VSPRERILDSLSPAGSAETAVVVPYEGIFVRDHWADLIGLPWWLADDPDIETQVRWRRIASARAGSDWFDLPYGCSRAYRQENRIEQDAHGVWRCDRRTGDRERLHPPAVGGDHLAMDGAPPPQGRDDIDALIPEPVPPATDDGSADLPTAVRAAFGAERAALRHVNSPLWSCFGLWGYEAVMTLVAEQSDLLVYACRRLAALAAQEVRDSAAAGADVVWMEDCMTDQISPRAYRDLVLPSLEQLTAACREVGVRCVHYYCGDPRYRWGELLSVDADALALEESKKGFRIEIAEVVERARGRRAILGNLDAVGVLQDGSDADVRAEVQRQVAVGRRNGGRFIMSLGSPVTPATPVKRVRLYLDAAREVSSGG